MPDFTFRLKARCSRRSSLGFDTPEVEWHPTTGVSLRLSSESDDVEIRGSDVLLLKSSGWASEAEAATAGAKYAAALLRSLARLRIGVDVGNRGPAGGGFTRPVIERLRDEQGIRVINDAWGLMVYESDPRPFFTSSTGTIAMQAPSHQFCRIFRSAVVDDRPLSDRELVSLDLFNSSFFAHSADARLLMLMMAVEAQFEVSPRGPEGRRHIERLIDITESDAQLDQSERKSILGSLRLMRNESIRQTGLRLVEQLGDRVYDGMSPTAFFDHCYGLRSALAHGACPLPTRDEVDHAAANLEVMASDLIVGWLRDVDPNPQASG